MNASGLQSGSERDKRAHARGEWGLMLVLLLAAAVVLVLAGRGVPVPAASQTPSAMNNHLYVPCSVNGCPATRPAIINNHLYVPCSVRPCERTH